MLLSSLCHRFPSSPLVILYFSFIVHYLPLFDVFCLFLLPPLVPLASLDDSYKLRRAKEEGGALKRSLMESVILVISPSPRCTASQTAQRYPARMKPC